MKREKFQGEREKIALSLGLLILGWYDYAIRFESKGEPAPMRDYKKFKMGYDLVIGKYARLVKKTAGEFCEEVKDYGEQG